MFRNCLLNKTYLCCIYQFTNHLLRFSDHVCIFSPHKVNCCQILSRLKNGENRVAIYCHVPRTQTSGEDHITLNIHLNDVTVKKCSNFIPVVRCFSYNFDLFFFFLALYLPFCHLQACSRTYLRTNTCPKYILHMQDTSQS